MDQPIASYEVPSGTQRGTRYTLHANRLVLAGVESMETVPLAHLASVRVAFERDTRKLNWAIGLSVLALFLAVLSGPLQTWLHSLAVSAASAAGGGSDESLKSALVSSFNALAVLARLMMPAAVILFGGVIALGAFFWIGGTSLTLAFAATERVCGVRGRDRQLMDFAELLGERLAQRKD